MMIRSFICLSSSAAIRPVKTQGVRYLRARDYHTILYLAWLIDRVIAEIALEQDDYSADENAEEHHHEDGSKLLVTHSNNPPKSSGGLSGPCSCVPGLKVPDCGVYTLTLSVTFLT